MAGAAEPQYLYLTTRFTQRDGRYFVIAEHGERAQWVRNLGVDPRVQVRWGGERFAALARVVDAVAEPALVAVVQQRFREKYGWGEGLVVEIVPEVAT